MSDHSVYKGKKSRRWARERLSKNALGRDGAHVSRGDPAAGRSIGTSTATTREIPMGMIEVTVRGRVRGGCVRRILSREAKVKELAMGLLDVLTIDISECDWGYILGKGKRKPAGWGTCMRTIERPKGSQRGTLYVFEEDYEGDEEVEVLTPRM